MATGKLSLTKLKHFVKYHFPYLRYIKYKIAHEKIRLGWKSYFRREMLGILDHSLKVSLPQMKVWDRPGECLIEISNTCNLRCPMCSTHLSKREKKNMDLETYRKVLERVKKEGIRQVSLYTVGEPLIYPWLIEAVSIAKEMEIGVLICTNANLPSKLKSLYETHSDWINSFTFSVDSATPETYEKMRRGGKLKKVIESCEWILNANKKKHMSNIALSIVCVISKDNVRELATFLKVFSRYTFPECIHFMLVNSLWPDRTYFNDRGLAFSNLYRLNVPCEISVFNRIYINNEGQATLCCRDYDGQLIIGSVLEQPIAQVWHSETAQKIRAQHLGKEPLAVPQCQQCYYPKSGVNEIVNSFVHSLPYAVGEFDDQEWSKRTLAFLEDRDIIETCV